MNHFYKKISFSIVIVVLTVFGGVSASAQTKMAILYSGYTEKFTDNNSPKVINQITIWELFLMEEKIPYAVIYDRDLESGISDDFDILILPSVNSISLGELKSMKEFLKEGKSILSVGSKLSLDENGIFNGFENLNELFEIKCEEYIGEQPSFFNYLNFNPIFYNNNKFDGILQISTKNLPMICDIQTLTNTSLGYIKINAYNNYQTSIVYGLQGNGKFVWTGFNIDDVVGGKNDVEEYKNIIVNSLNWLDKKPDLYLGDYPPGKNSSTIIMIRNNYGLTPELIDKLNQDGVEPCLVIAPEQKISDKIKTKIKQENYILDLSNIFISEDESEQKYVDELIKINEGLEFPIKTVLIPKSLTDNKAALNSLNDAGINIFLFPNNASGMPALENNKFIILPYYFDDQNEYDTGGVNFITYNSKIDCDRNTEDDFLIKISKIESSDSWVTTLSSLRDWWVSRKNISASIFTAGENSANLVISNNNLQEIDNLELIINWSYQYNINQLVINYGNEIIDYSASETGEINLLIEKLGARQTKRINMVFNKE
ncbi:MAG: hypothetical protein WAV89_00605 [Ignavibacteriaceae bacterium]